MLNMGLLCFFILFPLSIFPPLLHPFRYRFFPKTKIVIIIFYCCSVTLFMARNCDANSFNIIDTNQSHCYDSDNGLSVSCSGIGYDADYMGIQPSYSLSETGTIVTDNNTGLSWTQTPDIDGNGLVNSNDKLSQPDAVDYCENLSLGGRNWRLPSIKELYSLMEFSGTDPSGYTGNETSTLTPFLDEMIFTPGFGDVSAGERIIDGQYATTTIYTSPKGTISGAETMFGVNFVDGRIKGYPYSFPPQNPKSFYLLCVDGQTDYGTNDLLDNGDKTISDHATGLMWQQDDYHSTNFEDAVSHCENSTTANHYDWRVPNVKELHSIVDYSRAPDTTASAAIDPVFNSTSISNEGGTKDWGYYWASTSHANYLGFGSSAAYIAFGRALGYFQDPATGSYSLVDVHGAGAQRSNHKMEAAVEGAGSANLGYGTFYYFGPQGDILRIDNMVRCVRDEAAREKDIPGAVYLLLLQ